MRTLITFLLLASAVPVAMSAQPVVSNNEFYYAGDVIQMVNCNPTDSAGPAGANVTWNFSDLSSTGGTETTTILHDTSSVFSTSNLMEILPNGTIAFVLEGSPSSYVNGIYDTTSGVTTDYENYNVSRRPFRYDTSYVDTYFVNIPATSTYGKGSITETGDAYGTLILPTGTYTNVLRIKEVQNETDTTGTSIDYTLSVSYLWFDTAHRAPLLKIDSLTSSTAQSISITYLSSVTTAGIVNVNQHENVYTSYFDNSGNLVVNGFDLDKNYVVTLYNIIGNKEYFSAFSATDAIQHFDIGKPLSPGIYLVNISLKDEPSGNGAVIKVIKND